MQPRVPRLDWIQKVLADPEPRERIPAVSQAAQAPSAHIIRPPAFARTARASAKPPRPHLKPSR
jgi:hypothetical protein